MNDSKLDSVATSYAMWLTKKEPSSARIFLHLGTSIVWLLLWLVTRKTGFSVLAVVSAFGALLQFERRGFTLLMAKSANDPKETA
jgi:hypothetical protein